MLTVICIFVLASSVYALQGDAALEAVSHGSLLVNIYIISELGVTRRHCRTHFTSSWRIRNTSWLRLDFICLRFSHRHANMPERSSAEFEPSISKSEDDAVTVVIFMFNFRT
jgi:hypothetical protein